jgi:hypothetical protein
MKQTYHFRCIDKFNTVRSTSTIDADSEDEEQVKAERWCAEYLKGESGHRTVRVNEKG